MKLHSCGSEFFVEFLDNQSDNQGQPIFGQPDVSMNANFFPVQCSVIVSAALARDRILNFLPRKKNFYSLNFYVIDIKHLF